MPPIITRLFALGLVLIATLAPARAEPIEIAPLIENVREIAAPGSPGTLIALDKDATPVIVGKGDGDALVSVVLASRLGPGRIVALGHTGYLDDQTCAQLDTGTFIANCVKWAGNNDAASVRVVAVGCDAHKYLAAHGFKSATSANDIASALKACDVLLLSRDRFTAEEEQALLAHLQRGGGLVIAQTGWGWKQIHNDADLRTHQPSRLMRAAGLAWSDQHAGRTGEKGFVTRADLPRELRFDRALELLLSDPKPAPDAKENTKAKPKPAALDDASKAALKQAGVTAIAGCRALTSDDTIYRPRLAEALKAHASELVPTAKKPLRSSDARARFLLAYQLDELRAQTRGPFSAHPASKDFPGEVPATAERVNRSLTIDTRIPRWHSTGLYAPAGSPITIKLADAALAKHLAVRIGCHTDHLWHLDKWQRVPDIAMRTPFNGETSLELVSPFGGLIYVDVADKCPPASITVSINGAVEAPLFVLGKTKLEDWKSTIRRSPAPWAELACESVIVSVPSSFIRELDDPEEVLRVWCEVLDAAADLATIPRQRRSPERYVADVQISAGYMHSGYPIMTHLDAATDMASADKLRAGTWGLFHELGHNHQRSEWTFDGTTEVTCNLFSLYIMETVCKKAPAQGHDAINDPAQRRERTQRHLDTGAKFDKWKSDPFLALEMYIQLREEFGWEPFKRVFAEYRDLPAKDKPKGEQAERDQWMVRMSRATQRNLGPFFERWGVPTSESARASIKDLPVWMPKGM